MSYEGNLIELLKTLDEHPVPTMRRSHAQADVTFATPLPEPEAKGRWRRRTAAVTLTRRDFTGAGMCGGTLAVVTLYRGRSGALMIDPSLSETFALDGCDQASTEAFYHQLQLFFFNNAIKHASLRGAMEKGPYVSTRQGKIEGILQLVDKLAIELVHPARLPAWLARENPALPTYDRKMTANEKVAMKHAIEAAAFAESGGVNLSSAKVLRRLLDE